MAEPETNAVTSVTRTTALAMPSPARAGRAGLLAALVMLAAQLLWRVNWSAAGVPAFPEIVVAAIARLTPLSIFGAATENYGSLAKRSLFVAVLIGIVAVGYNAGVAAGVLSRRWGGDGRTGRDVGARLLAGGAVALGLFLVTLVLVAPVAHLGPFALDSSYTAEILTQLVLTFALFAVAWALFATPPATAAAPAAAMDAEAVSRRAMLERTAWGGVALAALVAVGAPTWRLLNPRRAAGTAADAQALDDILAAARAGNAQPSGAAAAVPTSAAIPEAPAFTGSAPAPVVPAGAELFAQLDGEQKLTPILTATPDFYHVSKNISDPTVSPTGWTLTIDGLVDRPLKLTYDDLVARATTNKITTLCCISNELNGNLIGTAQWTGVPLADLLAEAGVRPEAIDLKFSCHDDYEDSIPVDRGFDPDTLVVVGMNGQPLAPDHGAPARMIIPGIYGMKNVKWLRRIEAVDEDFKGYWQTRGWSDPAPYQIWARIDEPGGRSLPAGPALAAGVASAGDRGIARVEVSLDDGETWGDAILEPAINAPFTWVRWVYPFEAAPGKLRFRVRPTDGTGVVADEKRRPPLPDGATGWAGRTVDVE